MKLKCSCAQNSKLRPTGNSTDKPQWYCNVCKKQYYIDKNGKLTAERPAEWPKKKKIEINKWEIKKGAWRQTT